MNKRITAAMAVVRDSARAELTPTIPGLTNFIGTAAERAPSQGRAFPKYDQAIVRKGLTYSTAKKKPTSAGFSALYSMLNRSAAGAIIETAGRKNPGGVAPQGAHFINAIENQFGTLENIGTSRKTQGRLMGAALASRKRTVQDEILRAIDDSIKILQREVDAA